MVKASSNQERIDLISYLLTSAVVSLKSRTVRREWVCEFVFFIHFLSLSLSLFQSRRLGLVLSSLKGEGSILRLESIFYLIL